jgi:signal transduction histidine kinase
MRLADFISTHVDSILSDWVEFARTKITAGRGMSELALRDDAEAILREVARDMRTSQSPDEQEAKSQGEISSVVTSSNPPAHEHAMQRARSGFEVNQMVSEYRALRATVLRLWSKDEGTSRAGDLEDVTRFNEAIDQALADSLRFFVSEVDRARSLFLGVLGHDLRTPLGTIVTCTTTLNLRRPEDSREVDMIHRSADRMRALVDVVLSYTRRSLGGALPLQLKPVNMDELVRERVRELAISNGDREIAFSSHGDMQGVWDPMRLSQMVSNLVGNALKYGAVESPVTVTVDGSAEDEVCLRVHNFGAPINPELLSDIFEPLVRGKGATSSAEAGGANMGLGLYIAREVASAHFGSIRVTSTAESGTLFEVRFPRIVDEAAEVGPTLKAT